MKKFLLALAFIALALPAQAEFTSQEKTEIGKIIMHVQQPGSAFNQQLGNGIRDYGTPTTRPVFISSLVAVVDALWECHEAMRHLLNEPDRATSVPAGIAHVQQCDAKSMQFADSLDAVVAAVLAEFPSATSWANVTTTLANTIRNTDLDTFNTTLAYASPDPSSFPRVVGPHGDSVSARKHIATMNAHFLRAVAFGSALYREVDVWPQGANIHFREFIRYATAPIQLNSRIWGMDVGVVVHPQDTVMINNSVAAGSGLRGADFMRLLVEVSRFNGDPKQPLLNFDTDPSTPGHGQIGGVVSNFAIGFSEMPRLQGELVAANSQPEILTWWSGISNSLTATPPTLIRGAQNMIPGFSLALARAWEAGDQMVNSWVMFFHEIPPIPGGGGGDPVTCGAGTVLDPATNQCVASTVCPTVQLVFMPGSGGVSGTVECVEVP